MTVSYVEKGLGRNKNIVEVHRIFISLNTPQLTKTSNKNEFILLAIIGLQFSIIHKTG